MAKSKMRKPIQNARKLTRIVIAKYIRVSTDKQREEGYSIEIQKERLDNYVRSMFPEAEYSVEYREYVDDGYSGGSLDRPAMKRLIEDVKNGVVTHVVVVKLDRLSRSQKDTLYLIEDVFLPHGTEFISMGESFNTSSAFGRAVLGILSVFAQLERENIYERTRSGMQKRVELGYWPGGGRIPFGYDYDSNQGILVPNKDADTVRKIYDMYLQGRSLQNIANTLHLKYERLAQQILLRKSNTGIIVYNGVEYQGLHEPLITLETYEKALAMFLDRSHKRQVSTGEYLLTGLVYCGVCGAKMRYQKWSTRGAKLVCYSRQKSKPYLVADPNCDNTTFWSDEIEAAVIDTVFQRARDNVEGDLEEIETSSVLDILQGQRDDLERKLKRLYGLYAASEDDVLLSSINDLKKEMLDIDQKINIERERFVITGNIRETQEKLDTLQECWPYMTIKEQQNILRSVINKVILTPNHIHVDFKY